MLSAPGGVVTPLTEDVTFKEPPQQFAVQADGTIQVIHSSYPRQTCTVPKSGVPLCPQ